LILLVSSSSSASSAARTAEAKNRVATTKTFSVGILSCPPVLRSASELHSPALSSFVPCVLFSYFLQTFRAESCPFPCATNFANLLDLLVIAIGTPHSIIFFNAHPTSCLSLDLHRESSTWNPDATFRLSDPDMFDLNISFPRTPAIPPLSAFLHVDLRSFSVGILSCPPVLRSASELHSPALSSFVPCVLFSYFLQTFRAESCPFPCATNFANLLDLLLAHTLAFSNNYCNVFVSFSSSTCRFHIRQVHAGFAPASVHFTMNVLLRQRMYCFVILLLLMFSFATV